MNDYYNITVSCGDRSFEISPTGAAHLVEGGLGGFDAAGFDVTICPYAFQSGGYAQTRRFSERELSLTFELDSAAADETRRLIISMLDPAKDCTLDVTLGGVHRTITAIPCDEPVFSRPTFSSGTEVTLFFAAPSVFFCGAEQSSLRFRECVPLLTFPLNIMAGAGTTSGLFRVNGHGTLVNPGDGECGAVITVTARGGSVVSPCVTLGDEFIRCPLTLSDGDELVIDTRPKMKNITLNGERCFVFDKQSTFFSLPAGESEVGFEADSGGEFADTVISFTPIYYGV